MTYSSIFKRIEEQYGLEEAVKCGYLKDAPDTLIDSSYNCLYNLNDDKPVTEDTLVFYYPGCFTAVHKGHVDVIKRVYEYASSLTDNFVIILSPSNYSYVREKYPEHTAFDINTNRINQLKYIVTDINEDYLEYRVPIVDFNCMLNSMKELNFLTSLDYCLQQLGISHLKNPPYIVCGKDTDFSLLNKHTDAVKILHFDASYNVSTKDFLKQKSFIKKHCIFRCRTEKQYEIFCKHLSKYYASIQPSYLEDEKKAVQNIIDTLPKDRKVITICKEYQDILPYHKVSRGINSISNSYEHLVPVGSNIITGEDLYIIDSDIYTGITKRYLERSKQAKQTVYAVMDFSNKHTEYEIVDYLDMVGDKFDYPYQNISYRMSLPEMTVEVYQDFKQLKKELIEII